MKVAYTVLRRGKYREVPTYATRVTIQSQQEPKNYDWAQNAHDNSTASRGARHVEWGVGAAILILPGPTVL